MKEVHSPDHQAQQTVNQAQSCIVRHSALHTALQMT